MVHISSGTYASPGRNLIPASLYSSMSPGFKHPKNTSQAKRKKSMETAVSSYKPGACTRIIQEDNKHGSFKQVTGQS